MFPAMRTKAQSQAKETNLNHFVSRFTSHPWLMGTNKFYKLWINKTVVQATPVGPKNWGGEEGLYSQDVEDAFEKIETKLVKLHRKFESRSPFSEDERYGWAMWLLATYLRTPAAFLCSAEVGAKIDGFAKDLFTSSYELLARYVINPHCIELIANRDWQVLTCDKPYFLKPDSGVVLTDRLDADDCTILYPISPLSCFIARGTGRNFSTLSVQMERVFAIMSRMPQVSPWVFDILMTKVRLITQPQHSS
jgi:hypothetical protein